MTVCPPRRQAEARHGHGATTTSEGDAKQTLELKLAANETAPASARMQVVESGVVGEDRLPDVLLLISELVTNAVKHGSGDEGSIDFCLNAEAGMIRVEVEADGRVFPLPANLDVPHRQQPGGMGLRLLRSLADRWGIDPSRLPTRTVVWFELA